MPALVSVARAALLSIGSHATPRPGRRAVGSQAAGTFADVLVGQYSMVYSSGTINGYGNATQSGIGTDFGTGTFSWTGNVNLFGGQAVVFMARAGGFRGINPSSAVVLDATITTVPAPAAGSALALAGLLAARRRRR